MAKKSLLLTAVVFLKMVELAEAEDMEPKEVQIGSTYLCAGETAERDVYLWVGKIDQVGDDLAIVSGALASVVEPTTMPVGHAPIDLRVLTNCSVTEQSDFVADVAIFEQGYQTWKTAFLANKAGVWALPPTEIYWSILEVTKS
jgi:hypothetical protein